MEQGDSIVDSPYACTIFELPEELLQSIFIIAFGDYFDDPKTFIFYRTNVMLTCRELYLFVQNHGDFWCAYGLRPHQRISDIERWSSNFGQTSLRLRVDLYTSELMVAEENRTSAWHLLDLLSKHASRIRCLELVIEDFYSVHAVAETLPSLHFDRLSSLSIFRFNSGFPRVARTPLPLFIPQHIHHITSLRLFDCIFDWTDLSRFKHLTTLVLGGLHGSLAPSSNGLLAVIVANPFLLRLSLRSISFTLPLLPSAVVPLPNLLELDLLVVGDPNFVHFVESFALTRLQALSFLFYRARDMDILLSIKAHLGNIRTFFAGGYDYALCELSNLMPHITNITHLDVSQTSPASFATLLSSVDKDGMDFCRQLTTLTVNANEVCALGGLPEHRRRRGHPIELLKLHRTNRFDLYNEDSLVLLPLSTTKYIDSITPYIGRLEITCLSIPGMQWINVAA